VRACGASLRSVVVICSESCFNLGVQESHGRAALQSERTSVSVGESRFIGVVSRGMIRVTLHLWACQQCSRVSFPVCCRVALISGLSSRRERCYRNGDVIHANTWLTTRRSWTDCVDRN
jgi:hypothetical protein